MTDPHIIRARRLAAEARTLVAKLHEQLGAPPTRDEFDRALARLRAEHPRIAA